MHKSAKNILPRGLVVSCQALEDEPLHSDFIMSKMALAAKQGGAVAIRANSARDIAAIKKEVDLPIIGIVKKDYSDSEIFITPTMSEIHQLAKVGCQIIALDATARIRPYNQSLPDFIGEIRDCYPDIFLMADCATYDEGVIAEKLGFDLIATTLNGYTADTKGAILPNIDLIKQLSNNLTTPIIAEGGISDEKDLPKIIAAGAYAAVVGSAITRPKSITQRFVDQINKGLKS